MQNFEEDLGATLLDRNTKPLKPTPMGLRVYEQCKAILREIDSLRELVANDGAPSGTLRLGVPQTLGDVVLLDALAQIRDTYPVLRTQVTSGWGSSLIARMENGELDAATALFPPGKIFPEGITSRSIGRMPLRVVAAKGSASKRSYKLKDCYTRGWVLNPDGCGFRAGLQRALSEQGLSLSINLETFGTDLQLGLVASGQGLGLWLFHPRYLGNLQEPVELFGEIAGNRLQA
ncbi:HTH-type transcriptional regulator GltR [compost metagenome]